MFNQGYEGDLENIFNTFDRFLIVLEIYKMNIIQQGIRLMVGIRRGL